MKTKSIEEQLKLIKRGSVDLVGEDELVEKLKENRPLRIKAGFDPTAPDLHLGHTVVMQKLRQFQDLGHKVIFLMGDYTAMIGDPSGRDETRPTLSEDLIKKNAETYVSQASKVLDIEEAEVRFNSEWLGTMSGPDFLRLASKYTIARMIERDDFKKRYTEGHPIRIHEFIYPLLQGQDSVALEADVELGGTDQIFNLLVGRELQKEDGQKPQVVLTMPLLVGIDGVQKMSKSYGNYIGITDSPREIFGKVMSISDELMWNYYELLSDLSLDEIEEMKEELVIGKLHPKIVKENLAMELVARFHSEDDAKNARDEFENIFKKKGRPDEIPEFDVKGGTILVDVLTDLKICKSKSEARRMIQQGAVKIDDTRIDDIAWTLPHNSPISVQVGKRKFAKFLVN
ncbi:MAG: tyrosine--tRNA ligase [Deltaproteobacteria bacterium]|jgi:tyrosyl-tRNA synthetase|nr:tyrosine--tRNA ligase [Deltaproteobacteria bacterium]